jgi:hypothetical protein
MRDGDGRLTRYDDVGCLLRAVNAAPDGAPEAWVEDHGGGGWVSLPAAHLVRAERADTPMDHGLVAFADAAVAEQFAKRLGGAVVPLEQALPGRVQ